CGVPLALQPQEVKKHLGYMPENNPLPAELRVDEYLLFRGQLRGLEGAILRRRVDEVLELCELRRSVEQRIIGHLSKGFRQRVGIAETLVAEPKLVVMDEPTIGLDPHQVKSIRKLIERLRGEKTFFVSSHILSEVETSCDRVIIINHGRIVAEGTLTELRKEFALQVCFEVNAAGSGNDIMAAIHKVDSSIEQIEENAMDENGFRWIVFRTENGQDVTEKVAAHLAKNARIRMREIKASQPDLEEIFMRATQRSWEVETPLGSMESEQQDLKHEKQKPKAKRPKVSGKNTVRKQNSR
ncbi:MAG: ABC transporter ATP-binding protein, partial [Opitutales bacterium]